MGEDGIILTTPTSEATKDPHTDTRHGVCACVCVCVCACMCDCVCVCSDNRESNKSPPPLSCPHTQGHQQSWQTWESCARRLSVSIQAHSWPNTLYSVSRSPSLLFLAPLLTSLPPSSEEILSTHVASGDHTPVSNSNQPVPPLSIVLYVVCSGDRSSKEAFQVRRWLAGKPVTTDR